MLLLRGPVLTSPTLYCVLVLIGPLARDRIMDIARTAFREDKDTSGDTVGEIGIKLLHMYIE